MIQEGGGGGGGGQIRLHKESKERLTVDCTLVDGN